MGIVYQYPVVLHVFTSAPQSNSLKATTMATTEEKPMDATGDGTANGTSELKNGCNDEVSALEKKIIRQIEYYFGDVNLGRDKFLIEEIKKEEGWIPLETMMKFNRLTQLSTDSAVICSALKKSSAGLMEVDEDKFKIRRSPDKPLPENDKERSKAILAKSLYIKGFPDDATLDDIQEYFDNHGSTEQISLRRDADKKFKGSIFVIFSNIEDAEKVLAIEDLKYKESDLIKMLKQDYLDKKVEERKQVREKANEEKE